MDIEVFYNNTASFEVSVPEYFLKAGDVLTFSVGSGLRNNIVLKKIK